MEAIERVKENPSLLKRCKEKNQFRELCLEAVKQDAFLVMYIKELSTDLKMRLYEVNPKVLKYLDF